MSKRKKLENKLDRLWKSVGKESAECEICKTLPQSRCNYTQLHAHHIVGRKRKIVRWDLRNRLWVCPSHHTLGNLAVEFNIAGWFWGSDKDWMGAFRPKDKAYLEKKIQTDYIKWTLDDLEGMVSRLEKLKD